MKHILLLAFFISQSTFAAEGGAIGFLAGIAAPSDGLNTRFMWGGRADYKITKQFHLGAYILTGDEGVETITAYGLDAKFVLEDPAEGLYFGLKAGATTLSVPPFFLGGNRTDFSGGPMMGWDFMLPGTDFSLGPELSYVWVTGGPDTYGFFNFLVALKYNF